MDNINKIFQANSYTSYPANFSARQKTALSLGGKDLFQQNDKEINEEISSYLDILFKDSGEDILKKTDKLQLLQGYCPIKTQKLHYGTFYI